MPTPRFPRCPPENPLTAPEFTALRAVAWSLSEDGLPPESEQTPADRARIVTFFVLHELLRILDEFAAACMRGDRCHLVVSDTGRRRDLVVIDLRLV
jgi:hypothetical protein